MEKASQFKDILGYATDHFDTKLDQHISKLLIENELTLAVCESVTAGLVGSRLTALPGSSAFFLGGILCYHTMVKVNICGVSPQVIRDNGVVSEAVVIALARGVKRLIKSDIVLSLTGIAGPGKDTASTAAVGTVFVGLCGPDGELAKDFHFEGNRSEVRRQATQAALVVLKQYLLMLIGIENVME
ncbi:MAG: CinA family protein [Candidatus Margulisbacteria bacterium]|nr:CinA family protein [Candidatus Margulisiibacteriota bacterium]